MVKEVVGRGFLITIYLGKHNICSLHRRNSHFVRSSRWSHFLLSVRCTGSWAVKVVVWRLHVLLHGLCTGGVMRIFSRWLNSIMCSDDYELLTSMKGCEWKRIRKELRRMDSGRGNTNEIYGSKWKRIGIELRSVCWLIWVQVGVKWYAAVGPANSCVMELGSMELKRDGCSRIWTGTRMPL